MARTLTADDALALAERFHEMAVALGRFRFAHWADLRKSQRQDLEDQAWTLMNASSDMVTTAVGIALDDAGRAVAALRNAADGAVEALETVETVRKAIRIATAAVVVAGAIASKDPGAIVRSTTGLLDAVAADDA